MTCPACKSERTIERETPDGPHYARVDCGDCGRWLRWVPKPDSQRVRRPAAHRNLVKKFSKGFCEFCKTREGNLPNNQVLEGHHVLEYIEGGTDERENVQILCTKCHKLAHWLRTYVTAAHTGGSAG